MCVFDQVQVTAEMSFWELLKAPFPKLPGLYFLIQIHCFFRVKNRNFQIKMSKVHTILAHARRLVSALRPAVTQMQS